MTNDTTTTTTAAPSPRFVVEKNTRECTRENRNGSARVVTVTTYDVVDTHAATLVSEHRTRRDAVAACAHALRTAVVAASKSAQLADALRACTGATAVTVRDGADVATSGVRRHAVVVEYDGGAWMVMHHNGDVRAYRTARDAARAVSARSARGNTTATITTIQWRNVPDGFVPPANGGAR